jgi:hypothetical protein
LSWGLEKFEREYTSNSFEEPKECKYRLVSWKFMYDKYIGVWIFCRLTNEREIVAMEISRRDCFLRRRKNGTYAVLFLKRVLF